MKKVIIDEEFRSFIPPLSDDERRQIEDSVVAEGKARDALVVWNGILLDGYHRHEICTRRGLPYEVQEVVGVSCRDEAKLWILKNQLGRRNVRSIQRVGLVLGLKSVISEQAKERQGTRNDLVAKAPQSSLGDGTQDFVAQASQSFERTRTHLARLAGVSEGFFRYAEHVLNHGAPELQKAVLDRKVSVALAARLAGLPAEEQASVVAHTKDEIRQIVKRREMPAPPHKTALEHPPRIRLQSAGDFLKSLAMDSSDLVISHLPKHTGTVRFEADALYWIETIRCSLKPIGCAFLFVPNHAATFNTFWNAAYQRVRLAPVELLGWTCGGWTSETGGFRSSHQPVLYLRRSQAPSLRFASNAERGSDLGVFPDATPDAAPEQIVERLIRGSTEPDALVVDPFAGTGRMLLVAAKLGRRALGATANEHELKMAIGDGCERDE